MSENQFNAEKIARALGIVVIVGAFVLLGMVYYNYRLSGKIGYSSISVAVILIFIAMYPLLLGRNKNK